MTKKENELLDTMAGVKALVEGPRAMRGLLSIALAELQGRVLAVRCERGDVAALDDAAADADTFRSMGGLLPGLCPDCGCEFSAECFTCGRYAAASESDREHAHE